MLNIPLEQLSREILLEALNVGLQFLSVRILVWGVYCIAMTQSDQTGIVMILFGKTKRGFFMPASPQCFEHLGSKYREPLLEVLRIPLIIFSGAKPMPYM